jgi:hypothetical protein
VSGSTGYEVCLLADPVRREVHPFSSGGFDLSDRSPRRAWSDNARCWFLFPDGSVRMIEEVRPRPGPILARVANRLRRKVPIATALCDVEVDLETFKGVVIEGIAKERQGVEEDEPWGLLRQPPEGARATIAGAAGFRQLYEALRLPPAEDCLDLL